ncbi:dihydropteroate synthase [Hyphococcus flavus]|uniref:Dihydropteroate synthase n=1 Tax=Hyphococcus flavus TaxID=1866326 RepID=A0AAF0CC22_9PROT|nr:dihydropteroate synthase [Hyphococcus flavus]WDI32380.1 dihydropteroate synthase [Hyphococcus flavus]
MKKNWRIMGVVNITPDSFSDGGLFYDVDSAAAHALKLADEGADILDVGGESTRPGAKIVPEYTERSRVIPVIEKLIETTNAVISIDTRKPGIAREAVKAGASIWNDVSALTYAPDSLETAADLSCEIVLMHAQGDPEIMQDNPAYGDVVETVYAYLAGRIEACVNAGIDEKRLIIDPGIGFGKTLDHNLALFANLDRFTKLGPPVLLGASRKRFIAAVDKEGAAADRVGGSIAAVIAGLNQGVSIFRVHDVAATRQALAVASAIG